MIILRFLGGLPYRPLPPAGMLLVRRRPGAPMHHRRVAAADPVAGRIALNILDVVGLHLA